MENRHVAMFKRLFIVGTAFLATACVPIAPEPTGPCISGERALLIGETIEAEPSDYLPGHVDIIEVESKLHDQVLTVVFHLRDVPEELTFYREGMTTGRMEYYWTVFISESGQVEPWADEGEKMAGFKYRLKTAHFAKKGEPLVPTSGSISSIANSDVWVLKSDEETEDVHSWYIQTLWEASVDVSYEENTIEMSGFVPEISSNSLLVFETYDYFHGMDRIRCDLGKASDQKSSLPQAFSAEPQPSSAKADLTDLASILARMDGSESPMEYTTLLQEFSDCFLSNLSAREREEGLSVVSRLAISPAQITAVTMFQAGLFAFMGQFERAQKVDRSGPSSDAVNMYELLEGGLAVCEDNR